MRIAVSTKGQVVLPAGIRRLDGIEPGQEFEIERLRPGVYRLTRTRSRSRGLVKLLLECPVKGWFEPLARDETTDRVTGPELS